MVIYKYELLEVVQIVCLLTVLATLYCRFCSMIMLAKIGEKLDVAHTRNLSTWEAEHKNWGFRTSLSYIVNSRLAWTTWCVCPSHTPDNMELINIPQGILPGGLWNYSIYMQGILCNIKKTGLVKYYVANLNTSMKRSGKYTVIGSFPWDIVK